MFFGKEELTIKAIVFLGTNKSGSSREAIKAAVRLGYYTCLLTDNPRQLIQKEAFPEVHMMRYCRLKNIDYVREMILNLQRHSMEICAIVSFVDPWCGLAAELANEFGFNHFSYKSMYRMQNKLETRHVLEKTPYNPKFLAISTYQPTVSPEIEKMFPVVVKYIDSNGSKDVYLCEDAKSYLRNSKNITTKYPGKTYLVEEFLNGPQYLVETVTINKIVHIVAIIEQEITFVNGHFIITGYRLGLDYEDAFYKKLAEAVSGILGAFEFENGPCHLEMRYVKDEWRLVEVNPRIAGGGMCQLIRIGLGIDLTEETLKCALGDKADVTPRFKKHTYAHYIISEKYGVVEKVTGSQSAQGSTGVEYLFIKVRRGNRVNPPASLGDRYAYAIATGDSAINAKQNAIAATDKIHIHLL